MAKWSQTAKWLYDGDCMITSCCNTAYDINKFEHTDNIIYLPCMCPNCGARMYGNLEMKDIDGYVTKDELYRLISNIKRNPDMVVDDKTCSIIVKAISDMPRADVQSKDRVAELESLLEACEREFNYLLDCEIDNSSTRHHVASLLDQVQLRVSGDVVRSLCKRCNGHKCLTCKSGSHFESAESGE